jgi:hypothetical protein
MFTELLGRGDVPGCHALHFLQMATEKLAKAYRFRDTATKMETLLIVYLDQVEPWICKAIIDRN